MYHALCQVLSERRVTCFAPAEKQSEVGANDKRCHARWEATEIWSQLGGIEYNSFIDRFTCRPSCRGHKGADSNTCIHSPGQAFPERSALHRAVTTPAEQVDQQGGCGRGALITSHAFSRVSLMQPICWKSGHDSRSARVPWIFAAGAQVMNRTQLRKRKML